jgi:hypothetical protein
MAKDNRTLKLSILADVDDLKKKLGEADKAVETNADKISDFGKKAALAFAAAGAAATAFAISAVKNAAADQAAQRKLEETIRASTNATIQQTAAVASYIDKTSIAIGVTDDELRPALSRLVRSTQDVQKAQDLLNLALDISAATGKPLQTVTDGLGKAYDGNFASLGRLGLGLDQNIIKSKDFDKVYKELTGTFGNFAENEALSTEKQFVRIQIAIDEAKESIGAALLPVVERLAKFALETLVPALQAVVAGLVGQNSVEAGVTQATEGAFRFGQQLRSTIGFVISIKDELVILGSVIAGVFVASKVIAFVTAIGTLVTAMKTLRTAAAGAGIAVAFATGGGSVAAAGAALAAVAVTYGLSKLAAGGDEDTGNFSGGGFGQLSGLIAGGIPTTEIPTSFIPSGGAPIGGAPTGGIGGAAGATSLKDLADKLVRVQDQFADLTFQVATGGISKSAAQKQFDVLQAQFRVLEKQGETLAKNPTIINNISISTIDPEGAARATAKAINESAARSTGSIDFYAVRQKAG